MQQQLYQALFDPERPAPPGLKVWNGSDPAVRFAIYRNNVMASLIDALAENFPVLLAQLGNDYFRAMAAAFVRQHPPTTPLLAGYGARLPAWIADFPPLADWPWLADLARLEMLFIDCLHAADADRPAALTLHDDPTRLRLALHPSVRLLQSAYAIFSLWDAHQQNQDVAALDIATPQQMMLYRPDNVVRIAQLSQAELQFVAALQAGRRVDAALAAAVAEEAVFDPQPLLRHLFGCGVLLAASPVLEE